MKDWKKGLPRYADASTPEEIRDVARAWDKRVEEIRRYYAKRERPYGIERFPRLVATVAALATFGVFYAGVELVKMWQGSETIQASVEAHIRYWTGEVGMWIALLLMIAWLLFTFVAPFAVYHLVKTRLIERPRRRAQQLRREVVATYGAHNHTG